MSWVMYYLHLRSHSKWWDQNCCMCTSLCFSLSKTIIVKTVLIGPIYMYAVQNPSEWQCSAYCAGENRMYLSIVSWEFMPITPRIPTYQCIRCILTRRKIPQLSNNRPDTYELTPSSRCVMVMDFLHYKPTSISRKNYSKPVFPQENLHLVLASIFGIWSDRVVPRKLEI